MPLPSTMTPIATSTLASATGSFTFSNIPQTYTDLLVVINGGMATNTGYGVSIRINSDTGSSYSSTRLYGAGSTVTSDRLSNVTQLYALMPASNNLGSVHLFNFMNYSNATTNKTVLIRNSSRGWDAGGSATGVDALVAGLWRSTAAISSISFSPEFSANWLSGTSFTLYGVKAA
jgi:hypothetical protein